MTVGASGTTIWGPQKTYFLLRNITESKGCAAVASSGSASFFSKQCAFKSPLGLGVCKLLTCRPCPCDKQFALYSRLYTSVGRVFLQTYSFVPHTHPVVFARQHRRYLFLVHLCLLWSRRLGDDIRVTSLDQISE